MSDTPAIDCLRTACAQLAEKTTMLRQWSVQQDGVQISVTLEWTEEKATLLVRGPDYPKSFGRTASFTFAIQMDEATALLSHEIEMGLGQFIETVRKVDKGDIPLPVDSPSWEPGAGPPSEEPESELPESEFPESTEPAVAMDVVTDPQPQINEREDWISEAADAAHRKHQAALNWAIFCALKCLDAGPYPHTSLLGTPTPDPHEAAHDYLVHHLEMGFSLSAFQDQFGALPEAICPSAFRLLQSFEAITLEGDQCISQIHHPARLAVYRTFVYSPAVREALESTLRANFDGQLEHMNTLLARF